LLSLAPPNKSLPASLGLDGEPNKSSVGVVDCGVVAGFSLLFGISALDGPVVAGGMAAFDGIWAGNDGAGVGSIGLFTVDGDTWRSDAPLYGAAGTVGADIVGPVGGCGAVAGGDIWVGPSLGTICPSPPHDWQLLHLHGSLTTTVSHPQDWQGE
jgi:hypothetical protein